MKIIMQIEYISTLSLVIGGTISGIVWLVLSIYRDRGRTQLRKMIRGEITEPSGYGTWYALNITSNLQAVMYGILHFSLLPIVFWITQAILEPSQFLFILNSTVFTLPMFIVFGIGAGYDQGYHLWSLIEEDDEELKNNNGNN
jgi:hypothetical protein